MVTVILTKGSVPFNLKYTSSLSANDLICAEGSEFVNIIVLLEYVYDLASWPLILKVTEVVLFK